MKVAASTKIEGQKGKPIPNKLPEKIWIKRYDIVSSIWSFGHELEDEQKDILEKTLKKYPIIDEVYSLVQDYRSMVKQKEHEKLKQWIDQASKSNITEIASFAKGLDKNFEEVKNALLYPHSSGFVGGNVNRLKMIKRQMYGRANFDLLKQRVLHRW